jgi:uncharacterized protein YegP (UPF0339 family)
MIRFRFFIGRDDAGHWRWAIAGPDGQTVLACCAGPSKSRRACLQEIAVLKNETAGMRVKEWKATPRRKPRSIDPKP